MSVPPPQLDAGVRLRRLLAILAYLAQVGEATIAEIAQRFDMEPKTVVSELELAACCGLPPYTPDQLLNLVVDDERVRTYGLEPLRRPPRLTPSEGFALAAAARAMSRSPETTSRRRCDPRSASSRTRSALIASRSRSIDRGISRSSAVPRRMAPSSRSTISARGAGEESTRVVEPYAVVAREGRFYLDAFCRKAKDWRRFQVGRVDAVRTMGERVPLRTPPPGLLSAKAFVGGGESVVRAHVSVPAGRQVLLERVAAGPGVPGSEGRVVVPVDVADRAWFGLLLLRLGDDAEVLDPPSLRGAACEAARRILDRYEERPVGE